MNQMISDFLEVKFDDDTSGVFTGYGAIFNNVDRNNDKCIPGCFTKSLMKFSTKSQMPTMCWFHDLKLPIGEWLEVKEDGRGLKVKGRLWIGSGISEAERAYLTLKSNAVKGLSVGYKTIKQQYEPSKESGKVNVRRLEEVDLYEISLVGCIPCNVESNVLSVKSESNETKKVISNIFDSAYDLMNFEQKMAFLSKMSSLNILDGDKATSVLDYLGH